MVMAQLLRHPLPVAIKFIIDNYLLSLKTGNITQAEAKQISDTLADKLNHVTLPSSQESSKRMVALSPGMTYVYRQSAMTHNPAEVNSAVENSYIVTDLAGKGSPALAAPLSVASSTLADGTVEWDWDSPLTSCVAVEAGKFLLCCHDSLCAAFLLSGDLRTQLFSFQVSGSNYSYKYSYRPCLCLCLCHLRSLGTCGAHADGTGGKKKKGNPRQSIYESNLIPYFHIFIFSQFDQLRTKEQLGYIVFTGVKSNCLPPQFIRLRLSCLFFYLSNPTFLYSLFSRSQRSHSTQHCTASCNRTTKTPSTWMDALKPS